MTNRSWKTDGADLVLHGTIVKTAQKGIFFLLMGTIGLLCIVVIAGVFAFCSMRCGVIGTALSVVSTQGINPACCEKVLTMTQTASLRTLPLSRNGGSGTREPSCQTRQSHGG